MQNKIKRVLLAIGYIALYGCVLRGISLGVRGMMQGYEMSLEVDTASNYMYSMIILILLLSLWGISKVRKRSLLKYLRFKRITAHTILMSCFMTTGLIYLLSVVNIALGSYFESQVEGGMKGSFLSLIILIGIIGPFVEEVLFRGLIYNTLQKAFTIKWVILIQGILFGIMHMNLIQGIATTIMGIVLGYLVYQVGSIWPAIIIHTLHNVISVVSINLSTSQLVQPQINWLLTFMAIGIGLIGIKEMIKEN